MNTFSKILIVAATAATLAACSTTSTCQSGRTIWYQDTDGQVKSRPETYVCAPSAPPVAESLFSEGPMPAPEPGQGWWN